MAKRRMFSLDVVDTDRFIDMPSSARLLYYDLGVRADDDGFISPMKVVRMTGASADDLKVLVAKGFVFLFEDGVVVLLHWLRNNHIDPGKYTPSVYNPRLRGLKEKGLYVEKLPSGRPSGGSGSQSKRVPSIGKVRSVQISPIRGEAGEPSFEEPTEEEMARIVSGIDF